MNQKTLDEITGGSQSDAIKTRILSHALSTICRIKDVSNILNKNLSVISIEFIGILTFLLSVSSGMERNLFNINLKLK